MIEHQIRHQTTPVCQSAQIWPVTETFLELVMAGDRESGIACGFQKRQHVENRSERSQMPIDETGKALKCRYPVIRHRVGVGDQQGIVTTPSLEQLIRTGIH